MNTKGWRRRLAAGAILIAIAHGADAARCGATERWYVKGGTDPDAPNVDVQTIVPSTVQGLNNLPHLQPTVPHGDNVIRLAEERVVYKVSGRLALFKAESDTDYHLVIADDTLRYTPGGKGTAGQETGTSFIAEIPNADCVMGTLGPLDAKSVWDSQLRNVRGTFEARFPNGAGHDKDLGGIPVTITGVAFYDRPHLQTGRAINGIELHPILELVFNDGATPPAPSPTPSPAPSPTPTPPPAINPTQLLVNPGFEQGITGWSGTVDDIDTYEEEGVTAHSGATFAWMGGRGTAHSEQLYQHVTIPNAQTVTLSFWLLIATNETTTTNAYDKLYVQIRDANGHVLRSLKTYSNLDVTAQWQKSAFDVSEFRGRDVQVYLRMVEDQGKLTSFLLDDFALVAQ